MPNKYLSMTDALYEYICRHRTHSDDPVLAKLREETDQLGDDARMQISPEQGAFLTMLMRLFNARRAIEIGTFTGYSSICIARGLSPDGRLTCIDASDEWTRTARRFWKMAGVDNRIDLQIGKALDLLDRLDPAIEFDFAFIDAAKAEYDAYYEKVFPRIRSNGLIMFDNMLWGGRVAAGEPDDEDGRCIFRLNAKLAGDPRIESVLLPVADGIQLCRKR